jgi:hypothetical protein
MLMTFNLETASIPYFRYSKVSSIEEEKAKKRGEIRRERRRARGRRETGRRETY